VTFIVAPINAGARHALDHSLDFSKTLKHCAGLPRNAKFSFEAHA
jgi:hypothetical protein